MPIAFAPLNTELRIVRIGADEKVKKHLESLGITIDSKIQVLSSVGGNVILLVKDGRLALDRNLAGTIFVA